MEETSFPIKGRYVVLVFLLLWFYLPGFNWVYGAMPLRYSDWYWLDIIYQIYYQILLLCILSLLIYLSKIKWRYLYGGFQKNDLAPAIKLTIFIFMFSLAADYLLFYPLSYLFPGFVQWWRIDLAPIIYYQDGGYPLAPNVLSFISLVILAPVVEELAFRGILLHRWTEKWGVMKAILLSSLLFGIMHPDPLGAMAFGVAMSILYLQTQTLWVPMICHALNNIVAWFIALGYFANSDKSYQYTIEGYRSGWYIGVVAAVIVIIWARNYLRTPRNKKPWSLPDLQ
ncbi:MAG: CPBP family intramembrane metalloprotease [Thiotrichales bacterium]|nr:CPBP family intramembrane metalloprotease [Thiotrichales bacterium]